MIQHPCLKSLIKISNFQDSNLPRSVPKAGLHAQLMLGLHSLLGCVPSSVSDAVQGDSWQQ